MSIPAQRSPAPRAYDVKTFASLHGVSRSWVHKEIAAKRLPAFHAGGKLVVRAEDAQAWLASLPPRTAETSRSASPRERAAARDARIAAAAGDASADAGRT